MIVQKVLLRKNKSRSNIKTQARELKKTQASPPCLDPAYGESSSSRLAPIIGELPTELQ